MIIPQPLQGGVEARFTVALPARGRSILGNWAAQILCQNLPRHDAPYISIKDVMLVHGHWKLLRCLCKGAEQHCSIVWLRPHACDTS